MTGNWFLAAMAALVIYGFWGFFPKLAMGSINPQSALVYQVFGTLLVGIPFLAVVGVKLETDPRGIFYAILTGVAGSVGTYFYYYAASRGKISIVVSVTALYPLITILLAVLFLKEPISVRQIIGFFFAIAAIFLLSG